MIRSALLGTLFVALAATAQGAGMLVVVPLLIAGTACFLRAALAAVDINSLAARRAVFGAFALRWVLALFFYWASLYHWPVATTLQVGNGFWLFCMDALNYHRWALQIVEALKFGLPLPNPGSGVDYYLVVATMYRLFGSSPLVPVAWNILAWTLMTVLLVYLLKTLRGSAPPSVVVVLLCFWPSGLLWPTQMMKDSLIGLCLILTLNAIVRLMRSQRVSAIAVSCVALELSLYPLVRLRIYDGRLLFAAAVGTVVVAVALSITRTSRLWREAALAILVSVLVAGTIAVSSFPDPFVLLGPADPRGAYLTYAQVLEAQGKTVEAQAAYLAADELSHRESVEPVAHASLLTPHSTFSINHALNRAIHETLFQFVESVGAMEPGRLDAVRQRFSATGGGSAIQAMPIGAWREVVSEVPLAFARALLAPFPWDVLRSRGITGDFRTLAVSECLLMVALLPALGFGLLRLRTPEELLLALVAVGGLLALGLVVTNVGTLFRLRESFLMTLVAFSAYGFDVYRLLGRQLSNVVLPKQVEQIAP